MVGPLILLQIAAVVPGQADSICRSTCEILAVRDGMVRLIDQALDRNIALGKYAAGARRLVPKTEAPVLDLHSRRGWRIVASVYLDHDQDDVLTHVRFFGPDHKLRMTSDARMMAEDSQLGNLFGGTDEIFAFTSNEEHAYNARSQIWVLPERGAPNLLLEFEGSLGNFRQSGPGSTAGVTISRQQYDGVHAETKGTSKKFYRWDPVAKSLTEAPE